MRIRLTNPKKLDKVIAKLNEAWPLDESTERFMQHCVESIKEKIAQGQTVILESEIGNMGNGISQILSYWTLDDLPTDEEYLSNGSK